MSYIDRLSPPSIRLGTGDLAKYPFLSEAGVYLRESGFDLDDLERSEVKDLLTRAIDRINAAVEGRVYKQIGRYEVEILSFLISLLIVKSIGIDSLTRKYALAEARRAEEFLSSDMKKSTEEQKQSLLTKIFEDLFGLKMVFDPSTGLYRMKVESYLARASHFHEQEWKLVNRPVADGAVYLEADETVRLVRNELVQLILDRVRAMEMPNLPEPIKAAADEMRMHLAPRFEYRTNTASEYPPCVKHALEMMTKGDNLSHSARVMLATFLLAMDRPIEDIVSVFRNAPDFNDKITRYQIEHLAGLKGSHTKYSVPSCDKLRSQNLCYATSDCDGIINPVQFGRRRTT